MENVILGKDFNLGTIDPKIMNSFQKLKNAYGFNESLLV
jgi:hypothetical protein